MHDLRKEGLPHDGRLSIQLLATTVLDAVHRQLDLDQLDFDIHIVAPFQHTTSSLPALWDIAPKGLRCAYPSLRYFRRKGRLFHGELVYWLRRDSHVNSQEIDCKQRKLNETRRKEISRLDLTLQMVGGCDLLRIVHSKSPPFGFLSAVKERP